MDEVLVVGTEDGAIPTGLRRQALTLAVLMSYPYALVGSTILVGGEVGVSSLLIITVDIADLVVAVINQTQQLAIVVVQIEVHPTRAVTRYEDVTLGNLNTIHRFFADILIDLLFNNLLTYRRKWVAHKYAQTVLMAIQRIDGNLLGLTCRK